MADKSSIEWTDATWNPVTGCSRVSRGCERCYAERLAATRMKNHPSRQGLTDSNGRWTGEVRLNPAWLGQPLRWDRPRNIFVAAHGDLFHEALPDAWIDLCWAVMALARHHRFQVLTKRPERMRDYVQGCGRRVYSLIDHWMKDGDHPAIPLPAGVRRRLARDRMSRRLGAVLAVREPLPNVWPGVSAEDQATADERIPILLETPAAVRWLSAEPLLGFMEIDEYLAGLDWVVAGGESGPRARPMDPAWARSLRNQCICARVPFFFKQWGGATSKSGGCELDGRQWRQFPRAA